MDQKTQEILYKFEGKLVGKPKLKLLVCKTILLLPETMQSFLTRYCWFIGSMDDAWAFTFTGNDLKDQHLIFLSDDLMNQDDHQIIFSITHEIGHVVLKHRNSITTQQTPVEIAQQEREADDFANGYVKQ